MPPRQRSNKSPQDYTGRQKEELALANAEEIAVRSEEIGLLTSAKRNAESELVDLSSNKPVVTEVKEVEDVEVEAKPVRCKVNTDVEQMTYGHGNEYNLYVGREYLLPADVFNHLDTLGYIYH
jgi:hypothetical protein